MGLVYTSYRRLQAAVDLNYNYGQSLDRHPVSFKDSLKYVSFQDEIVGVSWLVIVSGMDGSRLLPVLTANTDWTPRGLSSQDLPSLWGSCGLLSN